jgi:hypothetical protein
VSRPTELNISRIELDITLVSHLFREKEIEGFTPVRSGKEMNENECMSTYYSKAQFLDLDFSQKKTLP